MSRSLGIRPLGFYLLWYHWGTCMAYEMFVEGQWYLTYELIAHLFKVKQPCPMPRSAFRVNALRLLFYTCLNSLHWDWSGIRCDYCRLSYIAFYHVITCFHFIFVRSINLSFWVRLLKSLLGVCVQSHMLGWSILESQYSGTAYCCPCCLKSSLPWFAIILVRILLEFGI